MFLVLLFSFNCPLQGFEQKRSPTRQRRGVPSNLWAWRTESELRKHEKFSQKGGDESCATTQKKRKAYNVKNLAKWRRHQVLKDARKCQSCRTLHP